MALNGIDISNWQSGINLAVVPCDFVVIKATEGTGYVNPDYERAYRQARTAGKCLGIYHYASGGNIQAEAEYFLKNAGNRVGEAMLVLDWEGRSNPAFGYKELEKIEEEEKEIFSAEFKEEISKLMPFSPVYINEIV